MFLKISNSVFHLCPTRLIGHFCICPHRIGVVLYESSSYKPSYADFNILIYIEGRILTLMKTHKYKKSDIYYIDTLLRVSKWFTHTFDINAPEIITQASPVVSSSFLQVQDNIPRFSFYGNLNYHTFSSVNRQFKIIIMICQKLCLSSSKTSYPAL